MKTKDYIAIEKVYSANNYNPIPLVIASGKGAVVTDVEGKDYLDFLAAYSAVKQGHCHPRLVAAAQAQMAKITLTSRAFHNDVFGQFAKTICELTGFDRVLPMNTGAEAVETAIKAARKWAYTLKGVPKDKAEIIAFTGNFSGRTTSIISFSSEDQYKSGFGPFTPGFKLATYGDIDDLKAKITANTAAVIIEPIQGEGGIVIPPQNYLKAVSDLCKKQGILLILDEIQTGFGRTGKMFCYEHDGIKPDMVCVGKALSGGMYPVSALLATHDVMQVFKPGDHGSTYGGNPLGCAIAIEALGVLVDENLVDKSKDLGDYMLKALKSIKDPRIKEVRGRGLFIGIELYPEAGGARRYCEKLMTMGILCKETHDHIIRIAPPLVVTKAQIDQAIKAFKSLFATTKSLDSVHEGQQVR